MSDRIQTSFVSNRRRVTRLVLSGRATQGAVKISRRVIPFTRKALPAFVAITIALSFLTTLIPLANASQSANTMECCLGKEGHCDSGIAHKKPAPPEPEPMCGLHGADDLDDDGITIVAESPQTDDHHTTSQATGNDSSQNAAGRASLNQPCRMDCSACGAGSTRQQNRERALGEPTFGENLVITAQPIHEVVVVLLSTLGNWESTGTRGPPSNLL